MNKVRKRVQCVNRHVLITQLPIAFSIKHLQEIPKKHSQTHASRYRLSTSLHRRQSHRYRSSKSIVVDGSNPVIPRSNLRAQSTLDRGSRGLHRRSHCIRCSAPGVRGISGLIEPKDYSNRDLRGAIFVLNLYTRGIAHASRCGRLVASHTSTTFSGGITINLFEGPGSGFSGFCRILETLMNIVRVSI